ncbi:MAG: hypothetical protein AAF601_16770 [Pseudomonadota bacterium]
MAFALAQTHQYRDPLRRAIMINAAGGISARGLSDAALAVEVVILLSLIVVLRHELMFDAHLLFELIKSLCT